MLSYVDAPYEHLCKCEHLTKSSSCGGMCRSPHASPPPRAREFSGGVISHHLTDFGAVPVLAIWCTENIRLFLEYSDSFVDSYGIFESPRLGVAASRVHLSRAPRVCFDASTDRQHRHEARSRLRDAAPGHGGERRHRRQRGVHRAPHSSVSARLPSPATS